MINSTTIARRVPSSPPTETGILFEQMITNILVTYPTQTPLVSGALMRVFQEKQTGKHKTSPWSIANEQKLKGSLAKQTGLSQPLSTATSLVLCTL